MNSPYIRDIATIHFLSQYKHLLHARHDEETKSATASILAERRALWRRRAHPGEWRALLGHISHRGVFARLPEELTPPLSRLHSQWGGVVLRGHSAHSADLRTPNGVARATGDDAHTRRSGAHFQRHSVHLGGVERPLGRTTHTPLASRANSLGRFIPSMESRLSWWRHAYSVELRIHPFGQRTPPVTQLEPPMALRTPGRRGAQPTAGVATS